jgi:hypothetical protein
MRLETALKTTTNQIDAHSTKFVHPLFLLLTTTDRQLAHSGRSISKSRSIARRATGLD